MTLVTISRWGMRLVRAVAAKTSSASPTNSSANARHAAYTISTPSKNEYPRITYCWSWRVMPRVMVYRTAPGQ